MTVDGTTTVVGGGITLTFPTPYVLIAIPQTIVDTIAIPGSPPGSPSFYCSETTYTPTATTLVIAATGGAGSGQEIRSLIGIPSSCTLGNYGIPKYQVPVSALTSTTTVRLGAAALQPADGNVQPSEPLSLEATSTDLRQPLTSNPANVPFPQPLPVPTDIPTNIPSQLSAPPISTIIGLGPSPPSVPAALPQITPQPYSLVSSPASSAGNLPVLTIGTQFISPIGSQFIVASQTLVIGGPAIVVSGTTISLPASTAAVLVGSSMIPFSPAPSGNVNGAPLVITFENSLVTADRQSNFLIGSQTLVPGAPAITAGGALVSLAQSASNIVIGSSTLDINPAPALLPSVINFDGSSITANSQSNFIIGTQTLIPGGPAITISGTPISLGPSVANLVVGSSTININSAPALTTFVGSMITLNGQSNAVIGTQTVVPGASAITISGTPISLAPYASNIVIGTSTIVLGAAPTPVPAVITFGGSTVTANARSEFVIGTQTIFPGASAVTISGTPISLAPLASNIVIGGSTIILSPTPAPAVITIGGSTITANAQSDFVIGTQTLKPGGPAITISGTPVSLAPSASALVIGTSTITLGSIPSPAVITIGVSTITATAQSEFIIGSQTLRPGAPAITVSGTPISLAPSASDVVIGTTTQRLGDLIMSAFGGASGTGPAGTVPTSTGFNALPFTGDGAKMMQRRLSRWWLVGVGVIAGLGIVL
ncbi:hypothetical protein MMC24_000801 [Lignoscripta atroalba]|nr:hypothetical protein [Lignoscripta atroalba]